MGRETRPEPLLDELSPPAEEPPFPESLPPEGEEFPVESLPPELFEEKEFPAEEPLPLEDTLPLPSELDSAKGARVEKINIPIIKKWRVR